MRIRIIIFAALFGMLSTPALALNINMNGQIQFSLGTDRHTDFNKNSNSHSYANLRSRFGAAIQVTDTLYGVAEISTATELWGHRNPHYTGRLNQNDDIDRVKLRQAFIDYFFKYQLSQDEDYNGRAGESRLRVGLQKISLPSATFGNPMLDAHFDAISIESATTDNRDLHMFFARLKQNTHTVGSSKAADVLGIILRMELEDKLIAPYFVYAHIGHELNSGVYWAAAQDTGSSYLMAGGIAAVINITNTITLKTDIMYGSSNNDDSHYYEAKGGLAALAVEYAAIFGTPSIFCWYGTGNDKKLQDHQDYGTMPIIASENGFSPTRFGFKGSASTGRSAVLSDSGVGTMGVGLRLNEFHIVSKVAHSACVAYIKGTSKNQGNGAPAYATVPSYIYYQGENGIMTNKDWALEFNLDSAYRLTENINLKAELGYIISGFKDKKYDSNAFNAQLGISLIF